MFNHHALLNQLNSLKLVWHRQRLFFIMLEMCKRGFKQQHRAGLKTGAVCFTGVSLRDLFPYVLQPIFKKIISQ